jgi:hypothetical protein
VLNFVLLIISDPMSVKSSSQDMMAENKDNKTPT